MWSGMQPGWKAKPRGWERQSTHSRALCWLQLSGFSNTGVAMHSFKLHCQENSNPWWDSNHQCTNWCARLITTPQGWGTLLGECPETKFRDLTQVSINPRLNSKGLLCSYREMRFGCPDESHSHMKLILTSWLATEEPRNIFVLVEFIPIGSAALLD